MKDYDNPRKRGLKTRKARGSAKPRKPEPSPREQLQERQRGKRSAKDYQEDLKLLRRYYTGFDAAHGFDIRNLNAGAKRVIRRFTPQIKQLKSFQGRSRGVPGYPHIEIKTRDRKLKAALEAMTPVPKEALQYQARKIDTKGRSKVITITPQPRKFPVFTLDPAAEVSLNRDGSIRVVEHGRIRDVYPIDRKAFALDPYRYMRDFMRHTKAQRVTMNVGSNVIGTVYRADDFVDLRERSAREARGEPVAPVGASAFVNTVEKYQEKDPAHARYFLDQIGAVSVLRGGVKNSNSFVREVQAGREALKQERARRVRQTRRGRMTGRR